MWAGATAPTGWAAVGWVVGVFLTAGSTIATGTICFHDPSADLHRVVLDDGGALLIRLRDEKLRWVLPPRARPQRPAQPAAQRPGIGAVGEEHVGLAQWRGLAGSPETSEGNTPDAGAGMANMPITSTAAREGPADWPADSAFEPESVLTWPPSRRAATPVSRGHIDVGLSLAPPTSAPIPGE